MKLIICFLILILIPEISTAIAENTTYGLGIVNDLVLDDTDVFYFEKQGDDSTLWEKNTIVKVSRDSEPEPVNLSDVFFSHPLELKQYGDSIYFTKLSDNCIGKRTCDYQEIVKMSKKDGSFKIIASDLKSVVHIDISEDKMYFSESDGDIWKTGLDGSNMKLIHSLQNELIINDIAVNQEGIFLIVENMDDTSAVMKIDDRKTILIADEMTIAYDLETINSSIYWKEISIENFQDTLSEMVTFHKFDSKQSQVSEIIKMRKTTPIAVSQGLPHHSSFAISEDFVYFANNTHDETQLQRIMLYNQTTQEIKHVDYSPKYMRVSDNMLYVIGSNETGFVIDEFNLASIIPEFPFPIVMLLMIIGVIIISKQRNFFHR